MEKITLDHINSQSLKSNVSDYVASAAKAVLGPVPFVGGLLVEIAETVIPNQRIDRIAKFAAELELRLIKLDQEFIRSQLSNENFTDLLEEGIRQAARSLTDERRMYLAAAIAIGITAEKVELHDTKHLVRLLGEISDVEVIILRSYLVNTIGRDNEFQEKHKDILHPQPAYIGASRTVLDKDAVHRSYKEHLNSLGLLERQYQIDPKTNQPAYEKSTGQQKIRGYRLTPLGRLLLRYIGLANEEGQPLDPKERQSEDNLVT